MSFLALQFRRRFHALVQSLFCLFVATSLCGISFGQPDDRSFATTSPVLIAWKPQTGVRKYRLQIARDRLFTDVVYDVLVTGALYSSLRQALRSLTLTMP